MAKKRVKRTRKGKEETRDSNITAAVDRISKLPDHVIYHILSFVPTVYAVRMSVLSRRWRLIWYSVPTLHFSYNDGFRKKKSFYMFVEKCLMHRSAAMRYIADSVVTSFKLEFLYSPFSDRHPVNKWLKYSIVQKNVKELDVNVLHNRCDFYDCMPSVALNERSLNIIKLNGVKLDGSCLGNLPSLKSLCLEFVRFGNDVNETLHNIMTGSPALERFVLNHCSFRAAKIKISSSSLKFLQIEAGCSTVEIAALNLQSLVAYGYARKDFSSCKEIKNLWLSGLGNSTDQNYEDQISKLTYLENLALMIAEKFEHINISSPTLKRLSLRKWNKEELKVTTETPNLVSFKYDGPIGCSITIKTPNPQLSGSFFITCSYLEKYDTNWYAELINFLSNINCSWNKLSLYVSEDKDLIIPKNVRKTCHPPWPNLRHLKVTLFHDLTRKSDLRKALQWLSPSLETLSIEKSRVSYYHYSFYNWHLQDD